MPEIVSDEYREGYAAFQVHETLNPYPVGSLKWIDWESGYMSADLDWCEMIGEKSV